MQTFLLNFEIKGLFYVNCISFSFYKISQSFVFILSFEGGVHHKISKISIIKKAELDMEIYGNFEWNE